MSQAEQMNEAQLLLIDLRGDIYDITSQLQQLEIKYAQRLMELLTMPPQKLPEPPSEPPAAERQQSTLPKAQKAAAKKPKKKRRPYKRVNRALYDDIAEKIFRRADGVMAEPRFRDAMRKETAGLPISRTLKKFIASRIAAGKIRRNHAGALVWLPAVVQPTPSGSASGNEDTNPYSLPTNTEDTI